ncbi:chymotrypsinogen A-like [Mytilus trossulus]|uniref:chymotrypsinogen A-like n=1 Tax=Mytilus trossulus TaxID=6551 RepID=UPI0030064DCD
MLSDIGNLLHRHNERKFNSAANGKQEFIEERSTGPYRHYLCNNDNRFVYCDFSKNLKMNVLIGHWGRTSHTICHHGNIDQNGCTKDVTFKIKEVCDGRSWCRVTASNAFFDNHDPCGGNPNYLNFTYECIPPKETCRHDSFKCTNSKNCIPMTKTCDGIHNDCGNGDISDEEHCDVIKDTTTTTTTPTTTTTTPTTTTTTPTTTTTTPTTTTTTPTTTTKKPSATCGVPVHPAVIDRSLVSRIVNGTEAVQHSWPWQIQLRLSGEHKCGASIIDENWIVTASHCFFFDEDITHWKAYAGKHNKDGNDPTQEARSITKRIKYNITGNNPLDGDISLLKLDSPLSFTEAVMPVCLPSREPRVSDTCCVTGWGDVKGTGFPDKLKQTEMPFVSKENCSKVADLKPLLTNNMICAGFPEGGRDACQGDSGGPFVCQIGNHWELHGIVSWGLGCAEPNMPGVYTNVHTMVKWIQAEIAADKIRT